MTQTAGYPAEVPFVGREAEAALVAMTVDWDARTPPGQLIVWGEPGIGKTRLLREGAARAGSRGKHVLWIQADPVEARVPYGAVSVAVAQAGQRAATAGEEWQMARDAVDVGLAPDASERMTFGRACSALTRFLGRLSSLAPTSIVVDDLHLLDQESLALLDVLLSRLSGELAFACTVRAFPYPLASRAGELLARLRNSGTAAELHLDALGPQQVAAMLRHLCGTEVQPELSEFVASRASGNPLFVLEIGRALMDSGAISSGHPPARIDDLPSSRHSAVLQRIYPLPVETRHFAQVASVLRRLSLDQLALAGEIAGLDERQTADAFDELERNQILVTDGAGSWTFFHPFVADALYEDVGTAERKRVHRLVAERHRADLDRATPAEILELAWHVSRSAEVGDRFTVDVLLRAAQLTRTFAPESAAGYCRQALAALPPGSADRFPVLALQARCLIIANRTADALAAGLESLDGLPPGQARTRAVTAVVGALFDVGRTGDAIDLAEREAANGASSAFLDAQRAILAAAVGDLPRSRQHLSSALSARELTPGEAVLVYSHAATHAAFAGPVGAIPASLNRRWTPGAMPVRAFRNMRRRAPRGPWRPPASSPKPGR